MHLVDVEGHPILLRCAMALRFFALISSLFLCVAFAAPSLARPGHPEGTVKGAGTDAPSPVVRPRPEGTVKGGQEPRNVTCASLASLREVERRLETLIPQSGARMFWVMGDHGTVMAVRISADGNIESVSPSEVERSGAEPEALCE